MSEDSNPDLRKENAQLKKEIRSLKLASDGSKTMGFLNLVSRYLIVGRNVSESAENLIRTYKRDPLAVHDKEIAEVVSSFAKRLLWVYLFWAVVAALPVLVLIYQSYLLGQQTQLLSQQTRLQAQQFTYLANEKEQEQVKILACTLENGTMVLNPEPELSTGLAVRTSPSWLLKFTVSNNTKQPIVLDKLYVRFFNGDSSPFPPSRSLCFAHPDTYKNHSVRGVQEKDLKKGILYLNPGIGGNEEAKIDITVEPLKAITIECYIPKPFMLSLIHI